MLAAVYMSACLLSALELVELVLRRETLLGQDALCAFMQT
ncbi:hypothetical protein PSE_3222 [Pseudovibrio sp. FO-BEG1]|nr:hypothetical protein PSE_3222 [Pseudovibrio sp. FO-BEG1]